MVMQTAIGLQVMKRRYVLVVRERHRPRGIFNGRAVRVSLKQGWCCHTTHILQVVLSLKTARKTKSGTTLGWLPNQIKFELGLLPVKEYVIDLKVPYYRRKPDQASGALAL